MSGSSGDRGSADDLRAALPRSFSLSTFVLLTFVFQLQRWACVARSTRRVQLDGLALVLAPLTYQPFVVVEVDCDPDDVEAIEAFAAKLAAPAVNAELREHFAPFSDFGSRDHPSDYKD
jgi:hypothetical protein